MARLLVKEKLSFSEYLKLISKSHSARVSGSVDDLWLVTSHSPGVFTLGRSFHQSSLLNSREMILSSGREIYEIERGGDVTYHGPGQVMVYPFIEVPGKDVARLVRNLEEVSILFLREYGLIGERNPGFPGVWCNGAKITSIGLAVRKWVTFHGVAFNHQKDDGGFEMIVPCGINGIRMTSLDEEKGNEVPRYEVVEKMARSIESVFGCSLNKIGFEYLEKGIIEL